MHCQKVLEYRWNYIQLNMQKGSGETRSLVKASEFEEEANSFDKNRTSHQREIHRASSSNESADTQGSTAVLGDFRLSKSPHLSGSSPLQDLGGPPFNF
jgi:hypothetical protein